MKLLYLDLVGGASGDMLLAALLDLGASVERVRAAIALVGLSGIELRVVERSPAGLRALGVDVLIDGRLADHDATHGHTHRPYRIVRQMVEQSSLGPRTRALALETFRRLAVAEGAVHGVAVEEVEFHEVGSDDAIADVVGVAAAIEELGFDEIVVSPVPLGRGLTRGAHGPIPLPGPATLKLLLGAPLVETELTGETVTPTGAALLGALATRYGPVPSMTLSAIGVGAGRRSWPDRPNVIRAIAGEEARPGLLRSQDEVVLETNLDDMSPAQVAALEQALWKAGAIEVWSSAVQMKKGRTGLLVSALAETALTNVLAAAFLGHSTTLGVRVRPVTRLRGERHLESVETEHGTVRVKIAERPIGPPLVMPEFDDCERLAQHAGLPVRAVFEAAQRAWWALHGL